MSESETNNAANTENEESTPMIVRVKKTVRVRSAVPLKKKTVHRNSMTPAMYKRLIQSKLARIKEATDWIKTYSAKISS